MQFETAVEKSGAATVSALLDVGESRLRQARIPATHVATMLRAARVMLEQDHVAPADDFALLIPMHSSNEGC